MLTSLGILALVVGIGSFVCTIIVLIKLFQVEGALKGILGFFCGIYTFIWGWINVDRLGIRQVMTIWSVLTVLYMILYGVIFAVAPRAPATFGVPGTTTTLPGGVR